MDRRHVLRLAPALARPGRRSPDGAPRFDGLSRCARYFRHSHEELLRLALHPHLRILQVRLRPAGEVAEPVELGLEGFYKAFAGLPSRSSDEAEASGVDLLEWRGELYVSGTFGHAGDGNLHPTFVWDRGDAAAEERAQAACEELYRAALALGGTVTGEHGIGAARRPFLEAQAGADAVAVMRAIKAALDPLGILNPGKVV